MGEPLIGTEAVKLGRVTRRDLTRRFTRVYPNVYLPNDTALTASNRAVAAWLWSKRRATLSGRSAAAIHGARWMDPRAPGELILPNRHPPAGLVVHRDELLEDEYTERDGVTVTTAARTAFDIGRRMPFTQALIHLDALSRATKLDVDDVRTLITRHHGARGVVRLRVLLPLVDGGAESPQETRTRMVLINGGLPRPQTQIEVIDEFGWIFARIDMGWREWKVGVEFDGAQHWTDPAQRTKDIERLTELESLGWRIIRISSDMLRRPPTIVDRVADALYAAGWRPEPRAERPSAYASTRDLCA